VPTRLYVYNNRISGQRAVGSVAFTLIKVRDQRLGDTDVVRSAEGIVTPYSSRVRTLVDAVYDWARFGSLPRAYEWIRSELAAGRLRLGELARVTLRYGDVGTIRRLGALLEREGAREAILRQLDRRLRPSTGLIPWIPTRPKRGKIDRRWGIVWNDV
jgi:predicted transcriptional regulator of viral defense system